MKKSAARIFSAFMAITLVTCLSVPLVALADDKDVQVENHTATASGTVITDLVVSGVDAPKPGQPLDDTAQVTASPNATWDIPVLWVDGNLQLATQAQEDAAYLPVLAFFVPQDYALAGDSFAVKLSSAVADVFGTDEIVSVYNAQTGITYILPASIRDLFAQPPAPTPAPDWRADPAAPEPAPTEPAAPAVAAAAPSWIDVYCSQTARDAFSDDDLEWLLDLTINRLQPQAVNLLMRKFPAFAAAGENGQIGCEIGLYVYYKNGDKDGLREHESAEEALAYVSGDGIKVDDGDYKFAYMIAVDASSLTSYGLDGNPLRGAADGKLVLRRDGKPVTTFVNTIVHEMFHAFMDDYNRTGMAGSRDYALTDTDDEGKFLTPEGKDMYNTLRFPLWFIEGSASAVENVYQFRSEAFSSFHASMTEPGKYVSRLDSDTFLYNYMNGTYDGKDRYADLGFSNGTDEEGKSVPADMSKYVSGYLATLYLCELKAQANGSSSIEGTGDTYKVNSEKLRQGLNDILADLHDGETLDQVIYDISPVDENGKKLYANTSDFEDKFVKGPQLENGKYGGDARSLAFSVDLLNYFVSVSAAEGRETITNGSILFPFEEDYDRPLDVEKEATADYYKIVESNAYVESTVSDSVALESAGKSELTQTSTAALANDDAAAPAVAAKQPAAKVGTAQGAVAIMPTKG